MTTLEVVVVVEQWRREHSESEKSQRNDYDACEYTHINTNTYVDSIADKYVWKCSRISESMRAAVKTMVPQSKCFWYRCVQNNKK